MQIGEVGSILPSTLTGLVRFLTNTKDNISAFSDAEIVAFLNLEYGVLQTFILSNVLNHWHENTIEGSGTGTIDLVAGTKSYAFPTSLLTIERIEISYTGDTNSYALADVRNIAGIPVALQNTSGNVAVYGSYGSPIAWIRDGYIYLDPIPNAAVTDGLKVWGTIRKTDLAIGGSGDQLTPVFADEFHEILSIGAAIRYLKKEDLINKAANLEKDKQEKMANMLNFYCNREQSKPMRFKAKTRNYK